MFDIFKGISRITNSTWMSLSSDVKANKIWFVRTPGGDELEDKCQIFFGDRCYGEYDKPTFNIIFDILANLQDQIDFFSNGTLVYIGVTELTNQEIISSSDPQTTLTNIAIDLGFTELKGGYAIIDADNHEWYYNSEIETWIDTGVFTVNPASNSTIGTVKGSGEYLKVSVDSNAEMTVNGLNTTLSNVVTLTGTTQTVESAKNFNNTNNKFKGVGGELKLTTPRTSGIFNGVSTLDDLVVALEEIFSGERVATYIKSKTFDQIS